LNGNQEAPDDWIDLYSAGLLPPVHSKFSSRSAVSAELDVFHGKALEWFAWIDLFRALVHDTPKTAGEKLALLKHYLKGECLDVVYGLGGGESAYKQALVRLKEAYGRRDVMRAAHIAAIDRLEFKNEPRVFKRFAERVRTHLFDLSRIGAASSTDIIEKVCLRLNQQDRLDWNAGRRGRLEFRSLNDFGTWICERASDYLNAISIAADQVNESSNAPAPRGAFPRRAKTHHSSIQASDGAGAVSVKKPFCYKCEKEHWLQECTDFKALSVGERVNFCMKRRLCFSCFGCRHSVQDCQRKRRCKQPDCRYFHHVLLHEAEKTVTKEARPATARSIGRQRVALGLLRLSVQAADGSWVPANIFADEGSDTTLMRSAFASSLKLQGSPQVLTVDGAGGVIKKYQSHLVEFQLRTEFGQIITLKGSTMKLVASPHPITDWSKEKRNWPHLHDLPVGVVGGKVDLLVGSDHYNLLVSHETREGRDDEPIACRTRLGWIVRGVIERGQQTLSIRACTVLGQIALDNLTAEVRRFCDTEAFGTEFTAGCVSINDRKALSMAKEKTRRLPVGYEVPIIWKEGEPDLVNNRPMAAHRFQSLLRRFQREPELERDYEAAMQKTVDQGYASRVRDPSEEKYFLAHHGVYKGVKLRVVFDAAASFKGKSLNDAMLSGPALQPALAAVVTRFRQYEIAWASDIEAMFSRFRLSAEDSNYFCFLWRDRATLEPAVYKMDRLPFGASCSPFVAIHTVRRIMEDAGDDKMAAVVRERMYVDDYLSSSATLADAIQEASTMKTLLADADLNLQSWVSNSEDFRRAMTNGEKAEMKIHPLGGNGEEKVLGVFWETNSDTLGFKVTNKAHVELLLMDLVSRVAGVFDPLGTASPIIVKAKIRLRLLGQRGLKWTDAVEGEDRIWWDQWFEAVQQLNGVKMPRCLFPDSAKIISSELHTFCDASEEAYAAVIYIRNCYADGGVVVRQVKAANKLAPKKTISVPKLELNAALLGARLARAIQEALPASVNKRRFWTDSSTVRNWIRAAAANYQVFVSNRIGEIQTVTDEGEWRFVPGVLNPADAATRSTLEGENFPPVWLNGPEFLLLNEENWPMDLPWMLVKEETRASRICLATVPESPVVWPDIKLGPDDVPALCKMDGQYLDWVKSCQSETFAEEIRRIQKKKQLPSTSNILALAPILDTGGVLRLGGRAGRAQLPYDQLHPPLLSGKHPFAESVVRAFHAHLKHVGTDFLLAYVRQHFWITNGRELVKRIRRDCFVCRRNRAKPGEQLMGDLPRARLDAGALPFTRTAIDLFGPMEVALYRNRTAKRWGVLYTCLVTRAVFLELVPSLSSVDFLLSLRKFIALYRQPAVIHSDNGTNFVGAERELREAVEALHASGDIPAFMEKAGIEWNFQPPRTPHFGGAHESLVKSAKRALYSALEIEGNGLRHPTEDVLRTLLYEVAGLLNTRPLTYVSSDPEDFRPLTPNDFLNRSPTAYPPAGNFDDANPREHYRYLQRTLNLFWDIWKSVYLQSLSARKKWKVQRPNFAVGDVVLEINKSLGRGQWNIGHITQIYPGSDGLVRAVDVQFPTGIFRRGVTELCLLESNSSVPASGEDVPAKTH
jgi:hypothetical protein